MLTETALERWETEIMARVADVPVADALARGLVRKCPTCGILHAGIRFLHKAHHDYCSTSCFRQRADW